MPCIPERPGIQTAIVDTPLVPASPIREGDAGGAVCGFLGITRPETHPELGPLLALEYEAARPLADRLLHELATAILGRHALVGLSIRHAVGVVPIGATSVEISAIADHRDAAFGACREAIDRVKAEIPIWKRERWRDGSSWSPHASSLQVTEAAAHPASNPESAR